ncbi:MAG: prepilin-type N-terminal cleavage/methylation domain-containing protein [Gammaproteobacteria bacterium]
MNRTNQSGFTLVEIAIVLVIIGLLLGGILKGQELINSARVRNLADTTSGVQAAYFGFVDRYRQVPGDWGSANAIVGIGQAGLTGGNENGEIDHAGVGGSDPWEEPLAMWEQLSAAGFIQGAYTPSAAAPTAGDNAAPENPFNGLVLVGRTFDYIGTGTGAVPRRHVVIGRFVPVDIMQELDTKMDDGRPETGDLRGATAAASAAPNGFGNAWSEGQAACVNVTPTPSVWNVTNDSQDCNGVFFF